MTQGIKFAAKTLLFSSFGSVITGGAAWGTRFVSQIPTQDILPAAMVGALGSTMTPLVFTIKHQFKNEIIKYFQSPSISKAEAEKIAIGFLIIFTVGITFLVPSVATPTLATLTGRNISYRAATLFSLLNTITLSLQWFLMGKLFPNSNKK